MIRKYPQVDVMAMGFPQDWEDELLWDWSNILKPWYKRLLKKVGLIS